MLPYYKTASIHLFRKSAYAQIGAHGGKTWFPLCEKLLKSSQIHSLPKSAYAQIGVHGGKAWFSLCEKLLEKCGHSLFLRKPNGKLWDFSSNEVNFVSDCLQAFMQNWQSCAKPVFAMAWFPLFQ